MEIKPSSPRPPALTQMIKRAVKLQAGRRGRRGWFWVDLDWFCWTATVDQHRSVNPDDPAPSFKDQKQPLPGPGVESRPNRKHPRRRGMKHSSGVAAFAVPLSFTTASCHTELELTTDRLGTNAAGVICAGVGGGFTGGVRRADAIGVFVRSPWTVNLFVFPPQKK